jgi:hypothetical protein
MLVSMGTTMRHQRKIDIEAASVFSGIRDAEHLSAKALAILAFATISCILASFWVAVDYMPLRVDGSWAAYPSISLMARGSAVEEFDTVENLEKKNGLKVKFGIFDNRSIRVYLLSIWFKYFGTSILSCRSYSLLEYAILVAVLCFFLRTFTNDHILAYLVTGFFATSSVAIVQIEDLRPDMFLTFISLLGTTILYRNSNFGQIGFYLGGLFLLIATLSWHTACLNLSVVISFLIAEKMQKCDSVQKIIPLVLLAVFITAFFVLKRNILDWMFGAIPAHIDDAYAQLTSMWANGVYNIFKKEIVRWSEYLCISNIPAALLLIVPSLVLFCSRGKMKMGPLVNSLILSVCAGLTTVTLLDPHSTYLHLFSIIPFLYLLFMLTVIRASNVGVVTVVKAKKIIGVMVLLSAFASTVVAGKKVWLSQRLDFNNDKARELALKTGSSCNKCIVVGPTALFSIMDVRHNITIIDYRSETELKKIDPAEIKLIIVDRDYSGHGFIRNFEKMFPEYKLILVDSVGNEGFSFLGVYSIQRDGSDYNDM